ncbi:MAG: M23 family metallopeptidase [Caldilineaceae bacterium]
MKLRNFAFLAIFIVALLWGFSINKTKAQGVDFYTYLPLVLKKSANLDVYASSVDDPDPKTLTNSSSLYMYPLNGTYDISSGPRCHNEHHSGDISTYRGSAEAIDFAAGMGTNIYAARKGVVKVAEWSIFGNTIKIEHSGQAI